ncbi:MAG: hypothetical protein NTW11_01970 [Candidatus Staskawiczbacteria bacterium]|nr:hypothetical protein [Candidatus Staskawiczbacteria bacterium]
MSVEDGKKEPINPESIEEPTYVYKKAEGFLSVTPEDEEIFAEATKAAIAAAGRYEYDLANSKVVVEYVEKFWRNAYENLPEIPAGYVRLLHHTFTAAIAEEIRQKGLKYNLTGNRNHIESTACVVRDMNEKNEKGDRALYNTRVESQKEGVVVVFELSEEDLHKYEYNNGNPGVIPAEFFVAALPERTPIVWNDYNARTFVPLSQRFNQKP